MCFLIQGEMLRTFCFCVLNLQLLTIAVLSIIVTAPVGAIAISLSGPVLLKKSSSAAVNISVDAQAPNITLLNETEMQAELTNAGNNLPVEEFDAALIRQNTKL
jgi:hypothetical protein